MVSERRALGQPRSTQRREPKIAEDEDELVARMTQLASEYGRYGYLRITALLRREGWQVNHKRIERLWRREGLKVPAKQPKRRRLWLHDGSCIRLRPAYRDHVWSYDFVQSRTHNGRAFRMLTLMDEYSRECLAIEVERKLNSSSVLEKLGELFVEREEHPSIFDPTTGASLRPRLSESGWLEWVSGRFTSNRAAPPRRAASILEPRDPDRVDAGEPTTARST